MMKLRLPVETSENYHSNSQIIRVISEQWVNDTIYCPNCGNQLKNYENNKPVADFYCANCLEEYELKSKNGILGQKVVDGAYDTMIHRLTSRNNPNFFFLTYNKQSYEINDFLIVPKYFFVEDIIEKRKPLGQYAKRAGWVGCNIIINNVPNIGKIYYVKNGFFLSKDEVMENWNRTTFIKKNSNIEEKGWLFDVLKCVEKIRSPIFDLNDVYKFENILKEKHPNNNNIRAKIRQQLQLLRDENIIEFIGRGKYKLR